MALKWEDFKDCTPVAAEADVVVAGAGIAGIAAALAAARHGKNVILLDKEYALGGMATLGLIAIYLPLCDGLGNQVVFGIGEELLKLSIKYGYDGVFPDAWLTEPFDMEGRKKQRYKVQFNPQLFALTSEKLLLDEGVHILYGTYAVEAVVKEKNITHLIVENKSGRSAIACKSVIDCTGDADICFMSGAPTVLKEGGNGLANWYYYYDKDQGVNLKMFGLADVVPDKKENARFANGDSRPDDQKTAALDTNFRFSGVDGFELSDAVLKGHEKMFEDILKMREKSPDLVPVTMSTIPLVRMSRRLDGAATMDCINDHVKLEDSVGMTGNWCKVGDVYEIQFHALHCKEIDNLLAAGRDISTTDEMWNVTRVIPPAAVSGQAAGTAAALTDNFNEIDIKALQDMLEADGVKLHLD
ncbi:MAG: FAD-dependent oxidoreductase [Parasporobacterium sp.]|nr:FAD-dependent oxidoreductase [Parasporobacterium sp.]